MQRSSTGFRRARLRRVHSGLPVAVRGDGATVDAGEGDYVSILLQKVSGEGLSWVAKADFLEPDRVRPHLRIGRFMAVVEGARLVARARILEVFPEGGEYSSGPDGPSIRQPRIRKIWRRDTRWCRSTNLRPWAWWNGFLHRPGEGAAAHQGGPTPRPASFFKRTCGIIPVVERRSAFRGPLGLSRSSASRTRSGGSRWTSWRVSPSCRACGRGASW